VRLPRFRIAWVMIFVAVAAINFAAVRAVLANPGPTSELLALGAMPMASVLLMGILAGIRRPDRHPFLLGFTSFGVIGLSLYVLMAVNFADATIGPYLEQFLEPIVQIIGRDQSAIFILTVYSIAVVLLGWPQVAFALLGGFVSRRYKITVTRR
jgi:hypothetical protein